MFLVGGYRSNQLQFINFDGVADLTDAKEKQWIMLGFLTYEVFLAGVQFFDQKLFILGTFSRSHLDYVQSFDLLTNTTKISGV